jgi:hypothetical protein
MGAGMRIASQDFNDNFMTWVLLDWPEGGEQT